MTKIHELDSSGLPLESLEQLDAPDQGASLGAKMLKIDPNTRGDDDELKIKETLICMMHLSDALGFDTYGLVGQAFEMRAEDLADIGYLTENPAAPTPEEQS